MRCGKNQRSGFSLVELVVVIIIIGILAAIATQKFGRAASAARETTFQTNFSKFKNAIEAYALNHNGTYPGPTAADVANQLTQYSSIAGAVQTSKDSTHRFGPYLDKIPLCTVGENAGKDTADDILIDSTNSPPTPNTSGGEGWVYNPTTGELLPNTEETDDAGVPFTDYR